jgi:hypothetical protein
MTKTCKNSQTKSKIVDFYTPGEPKESINIRINVTTIFLTKSYLLNTIKPFSGHENRSLAKFQKPSQGG